MKIYATYIILNGNLLQLSFDINDFKQFLWIYQLIFSYSTILPTKIVSNTATCVVHNHYMLTL